ncbi:Rieske 2Fe-2S domain-containing protein [Undibacterium sp. RTI2.1]|uniref:Rieske (2Fe-2S) protein n=1 Tax=unclassified Undibacterium TaxID=2630295 RepID=UPI002AB3AF0D|nr:MULTISPECIES: Rieske 2Fe-2S domain-containing protein [unclassified Undibacterium]MDY7540140.1 Rieske 2Fe-2S domain-containing protein [Undibacterium sp. 5I1]MEB0030313.1 Rieske 2Fe-2S domain-containing protein [Undibacterium sp. RTI2.1]MEB0115407.1 Rieske 2Fe-2S domain-containing protein [Undibacterium sp. RTI2.2]MEB0230613.1 Rieske 2Fe-2S domain-containing protein [Undibacterium sp. 10I3]MEB0257067.1 Rieske 2Fe-2S domain-containing protein [Undibacterium sp. 5I1]
MSDGMYLCNADEVIEGASKGFVQLGIFVLRYQGEIHAYRDACPHYGDTPLAWRKDEYFNADRTRITCAAHGAQFEPVTGKCLLGPCLGQTLTKVPLTILANGDLRCADLSDNRL